MLAGVIKVGDAVGRLKGRPSAVGREIPAHRVHVGIIKGQRTHDHHVPLPALGLVDGGNGDPSAATRKPASRGSGRRTVHRYASPLQGIQVAHGPNSLYRVQQQRHLVVLGNHPFALQEPHQLRQLPDLISRAPTLHGQHRRIIPICAGIMGRDGLGVTVGPAARIGIGPVGGSGHPPVVEIHDGGMAAVVDVELHGMTAGEAVGKLQQVPHAGSPKPVDALVVVPHHADVAVAAGQPPQHELLDVAGVLVLVADQVPDAACDRVGDPVVLQELRSPPLQVAEVRAALIPEQVPVAAVAPAQGGVQRVPGTDQILGVDELVAQPLEIPAAVPHHQARLLPAPARPLQNVPLGPNTSS